MAAASRLGKSTGADKTEEFSSISDQSKLRVQFKRLRNKKKDPSRRRVWTSISFNGTISVVPRSRKRLG